MFKEKVYGPVIKVTVGCYFLMGLGALLLLIVLLLLAYTTFRSVSTIYLHTSPGNNCESQNTNSCEAYTTYIDSRVCIHNCLEH